MKGDIISVSFLSGANGRPLKNPDTASGDFFAGNCYSFVATSGVFMSWFYKGLPLLP